MTDDAWKATELVTPASEVCEKFGHQPEKREAWNLDGSGVLITKCLVCGQDLFYGEMLVRFTNRSKFVKFTLKD